MSEALERVIAEQQQEIDRLRSWQRMNTEQWAKAMKQQERVAMREPSRRLNDDGRGLRDLRCRYPRKGR